MSQTPQQFLAGSIQEYGFLLHEKALCEARGYNLPAKSKQDLQELEGWIQNNVPPQVAQVAYDKAMHHAESFRRQFNDMEYDRHVDGFNNEVENASEKMTKDFTTGPLNAEGRNAVAAGEKVSLKTGKVNFDKPMWDQVAKKTGFKGYKELFEAQDDLVQLKGIDEDRYESLLKKKRAAGHDLRDGDVEVWGKAGVAIGLMERQEEADKDMPEREVYEPSSQDQRKAQMQDAWMDETQTPPVDFVEDIDPAYMADENMTGDIARAWAANE